MNSSEKSPPIRILTDIQIMQSSQWCEKTDYVGNLSWRDNFGGNIPLKLRNKLSYLLDLITIIKYRREYDVVINASIKAGQCFALFKRIFRIKTPKHILLELMLDEENKAFGWRIKKMIQKVAFSSVDLIFVSSTGETATYAERFKLPKDRFRFLPFHTNVIEPRMINHSTDYILSAGKTGRDYATLADAVAGIKKTVVVVSDKFSVKDVKFPPNVKVLVDIPYPRYLDLLYNCLLVVVPLHKLMRSTGQVAILEAMALGKPVIATETTGTIDYIQSGLNGILVPAGNARSLNDGIEKLINDRDLYKKVATNALESVRRYHTFDYYIGSIFEEANKIVNYPYHRMKTPQSVDGYVT